WQPRVMLLTEFSMIQRFEYLLLMTLAQLPCYFSAAWLIETVGLTWILVIFLIGTASSASIFGTADTLGLLLTAGILLSFVKLGAWG
ncbi:UNVERIFIED_CONTAM: MFS transporter, partial [Bacillus subtilis]